MPVRTNKEVNPGKNPTIEYYQGVIILWPRLMLCKELLLKTPFFLLAGLHALCSKTATNTCRNANITHSSTSTRSSVVLLRLSSVCWCQASDSTLLISQSLNSPESFTDMLPSSLFSTQLNIKHMASSLKPASFSHPQRSRIGSIINS